MDIFAHISSDTLDKASIADFFKFKIRRAIINSSRFTSIKSEKGINPGTPSCCSAILQDDILWVDIREKTDIPGHEFFWVRVSGALGAGEIVLITHALAEYPDYQKNPVLSVVDHVNLSGTNPLTGPNQEEWGPRFPDMANIYKTFPDTDFPGTVAVYPGKKENSPYLDSIREVFAHHSIVPGIVPGAITARHAGMDCYGFVLSSGAEQNTMKILAESILNHYFSSETT